MTEYERTRPRTASERAYRLLPRAYPFDFRREFGDAMVEFFRDRIVRAKQEGVLARIPTTPACDAGCSA